MSFPDKSVPEKFFKEKYFKEKLREENFDEQNLQEKVLKKVEKIFLKIVTSKTRKSLEKKFCKKILHLKIKKEKNTATPRELAAAAA